MLRLIRLKLGAIHSLLAAVFLAGCADVSTRQHMASPPIDLVQVKLDAQEARGMINAYRATRGLAPLTMNDRLTQAAAKHSADLAERDRITHKGADGSDPWERVRRTGYKPRLAAENVGAGQMSFAEVLQGWKDSPGHNRNLLLSDATQMGIALEKNANSRFRTFWTLVLGRPANRKLATR